MPRSVAGHAVDHYLATTSLSDSWIRFGYLDHFPGARWISVSLPLTGDGAARVPAARRSRWGWLLRHVFRPDVDTCSLCGGPMRWIEAATTQGDIARLLAKHGLAPQPPPDRRARVVFGQLAFSFGEL